MIKKIEITDFESHKSTSFEFGPGFNCIHGKSNNGKSSVLRALELAGYGVWAAGENKKKGIHGPVRIGSKHCEIYVESDLGYVKTKRGKGTNEWETKNFKTGEVNNFKNPGSGPVLQAQEILGLETMKVADQNIRFNWSDQRDKHFLIDEVEGKNSSPSFVAAVLDEVGGLSGCEDLIRSLASDKSKFEQEMKKSGEEATQVEEELEKFAKLEEQLATCKKAEDQAKLVQDKLNKAEKARKTKERIENTKEEISTYAGLEGEIKKREKAERALSKAIATIEELNRVRSLQSDLSRVRENIDRVEKEYTEINKIDIKKAQKLCASCRDNLDRCRDMKSLFGKIIRKKLALDKIPEDFIDFESLKKLMEKASKKIDELQKVAKTTEDVSVCKKRLEKASSRFEVAEKKLEEVKEELKEHWETADGICPLCMQPVSEECLEKMMSGV